MVCPVGLQGDHPTVLAPRGIPVPVAGLAIAVTRDGASFATPDDAGYVNVFDTRTLTRRRLPVDPGTQGSAVALSPDGRSMAATTPTGRLRFGALSLIWGFSFLLIKVGTEGYAPFQVTFGRLVFGTAVLAAAMAVKRQRLPRCPRDTRRGGARTCKPCLR